MPDITNPQTIAFSNGKARTFAEVLLSAITTARQFEADYGAQSGDQLFPNTADLLADGSETDGRPRVQAQTVRALRTMAQDLVIWADTGNPKRETRLRTLTDKGAPKY